MSLHAWLNFKTGALQCDHCGVSVSVAMPAPADMIGADARAFAEVHRDCPPPGATLPRPCSAVEHEELLARRQAMEHSGRLCMAFHKAEPDRNGSCPFCEVEMVYGDCGACSRPRPLVVIPRVDLNRLVCEMAEANKGGIKWVEKEFAAAREFLEKHLALGGAA